MTNRLHKLATLTIAGALLASTGAAQAATAWPVDMSKIKPARPAGQAASAATGVSAYAVVRAGDATVQFGSNVLGAAHIATGLFDVEFNSNISRCSYAATLGDPIAHTAPPAIGFISVVNTAHVNGDPQGVAVITADPTGAPADINFHITVTC